MHRFRLAAAALLAATLTSACYRVTVVTGAKPTGTVLDKQWNHSFIDGLVPPAELAATPQCAGGNVSKVVTQRTFLNGLVAGVTWGIYTPLSITATCGR